MARRSLQASVAGIEKAKRAFKRREWTQEDLACEVGIETRQPIWKFFTGKSIERQTFQEICFRLNLDWQEIAVLPTDNLLAIEDDELNDESNINALVQTVRERRRDKIQAQCGTVRLLDTAQPTALEDISVSVEIWKHITSQRWLDVSQLHRCHAAEFNCHCDRDYQERIPAMQAVAAYPKLMILGKPGSGKTILLQQIALACDRGELLPDRIPISIRLKNFAEDASETQNFSLVSYISQELSKSDISEQQVETLLDRGKALILLSGLDELPEEYRGEVQKQIRKLTQKYDKNRFAIACRISAQQYQLEEFTNIEIADFSSSQIEAFVHKWFVNVGKNSRQSGAVKAVQFLQKLQLSENQQIRELAKTPLLLHLACSMFQARLDFPTKHSELYKQALDILLVRWDETRGIERDGNYSYQLPLPHKLKLLSQIAAISFERGDDFLTQSNLLRYIKDYLRTLPNTPANLDELELIGEAVLKSLSAQHGILTEQARGIYSFLHPIFQEYLTARSIVASYEPQVLNKNLKQLTTHMSEPRWRRVFLLSAEVLENADALIQLMQQYGDEIVADDERLQQFLIWLYQKALSVEAPYKPAAIRAFYLTLDLYSESALACDLSLALAIDLRLADRLAPDLALDLALKRLLSLIDALPERPSVEQILALNFALPHDLVLICHSKLQPLLQEFKEQILQCDRDREKLQAWWNDNGSTWVEKLKSQIVWYRNTGYQWQFNQQQEKALYQYYAAQHLLLDCLKCSCGVSAVRDKIEETLLLPVTEGVNLWGVSSKHAEMYAKLSYFENSSRL